MRIAYLGIAGILFSTGAFSSTISYTVSSSGDTLPYGTFSSGSGDLRGCLFNINKSGTANDYVISFDNSISTIDLRGILPPIGLNQTPTSVTVDGSGGSSGTVTINGQGVHPGFFAYSNPVTFKNLNIANTISEGGSGSGGALGGGGAIFVGKTASVTLENISITESEAIGGNGAFGRVGNYAAGGGGMCGGNGGSTTLSGGGGGGFGSNGGEGTDYGGGGGGGLSPYGGGAGTDSGNGGSRLYPSGAQGGGVPGHSGGSNYRDVYAGGTYCGGGGSGTIDGGAGGGGYDGQNGAATVGGNGGPFGGGGGAYFDPGGNGGAYGGGAAGAQTFAGSGSYNGIGGGGGGGSYLIVGYGGNGGFGGGGGGCGNIFGSGGVGGGNGTTTGGGGGAGFGGGVFVAEGGSLTIQGAFSVSGCSVAGGTPGSGGGGNGAAVGSGLFFNANSSNVSCTLAPGVNDTITLSNDLADDNILNVPSGASYGPGGSGSLSLHIGGEGTTLLSAGSSATHVGTTTVSGFFRVNGTIPYSDVTVSSGGTLAGTGTLGGTLSLNGDLSPGNSIGTLYTGSTTINSGATYYVEINDAGSSDLLDVIGSVTILGGTLDVVPDVGTYGSDLSYTIIETTTGITGTFSTITQPFRFFSVDLNNTGNSLVLSLEFTGFTSLGLVGNAEAVAFAMNEVVTSGNSALNGIVQSLEPLTTSEISSAFNEMQPALFKGLTISQENNAVKVQNSLGFRMQNEMDRKSCYSFVQEEKDPSNKLPCAKDESMIHIWADGFGDVLRQKSNFYAESPQFGYQNKTGGVVVGLDGKFADYFYFGALGGYTGSDIHWMNNQGKGDIDTGYGGLYVSALGKMFYANASVIGGWSHFHAQRNVIYPGMNATATNSHGGAQILSHLDTGVNFGMKGFTLRPFDSFDYISQSEGSYTETGAGALNLKVKSNNAIMLRNELGLQFAGCFCVGSSNWTLSPKISWVREVRVKGSQYTAEFVNTDTAFEVTGYFPNRSLVSPGVMISGMMWKDRLGLDLYYDGEFGDQYSDHNYGGQIRFGF